MNHPLVTVIVTTRNNETTLGACLASIAAQSYDPIELIVIDNNSTDATPEIAGTYTPLVFTKGPERSAQRNYGASLAHGEYLLIIDSDMELSEHVIQDCINTVQDNPDTKAAIIPEESFGEGFWAKCKKLERSFYIGQDAIEAARFFDAELYSSLGGYNERMTGGEDWDLTRRARAQTKIGRAYAYIFHNEGRPRFLRTVKKVHYYARNATAYLAENKESVITSPSGPLHRYKLFLSHPRKLLRNPLVGMGMLTLKTTEYAAGALGLIQSRSGRDKQTIQTTHNGMQG